MNDHKKEGQIGIVMTGFEFFPSKLVEHTCYTACTVEITNLAALLSPSTVRIRKYHLGTMAKKSHKRS